MLITRVTREWFTLDDLDRGDIVDAVLSATDGRVRPPMPEEPTEDYLDHIRVTRPALWHHVVRALVDLAPKSDEVDVDHEWDRNET